MLVFSILIGWAKIFIQSGCLSKPNLKIVIIEFFFLSWGAGFKRMTFLIWKINDSS